MKALILLLILFLLSLNAFAQWPGVDVASGEEIYTQDDLSQKVISYRIGFSERYDYLPLKGEVISASEEGRQILITVKDLETGIVRTFSMLNCDLE